MNLGVYGARKVYAELNREGVPMHRGAADTAARVRGSAGIRPVAPRIGDGAQTERPLDLVKRRFEAKASNQLWVADLTYIRTHAAGSTPRSLSTCSSVGW